VPIKLCIESGCPNPATARGRCDEHRKTRERERSRVRRQEARDRNRMYASKQWAIFRRRKLSLNPICELCDQALATEVHHKVAMGDGGAPYSFANAISTCKPCHSRETRREQLDRQGRVEHGSAVSP
jgi:5-methylcytosine-specific restriction enzyme A